MQNARFDEVPTPRLDVRTGAEPASAVASDRAMRIAYWVLLGLTIYGSLYPFEFA